MDNKDQSKKIANLLVIVGPTAVGKTDLSLSIAKKFDGEIISADSRLFYKGLDIGTAKPSIAERSAVPHHLINICKPDQTLTLGQYQRLAYRAIDDISERGHLPLLVGGTGQYIMAVVEGWGIPEIAPHPALRRQLEKLGPEELARWLYEIDPLAAARIDPRNMRRVVRALEVALVSGRPISELQEKTPPPYNVHIIGLHRDRESLYERIDNRVDAMISAGLVQEVAGLREQGYRAQLPSMSGLGYRQILTYLRGEMSLDEAVDRIKFETHRFARQQSTWFRQDDPRITWFDLQEDDRGQAVIADVHNWLGR
ncbi:MAG: tRNA (adenosine(37)-N6)-dimethylallyltransferase MiaA [Anaerolineales bacterium]